MCGVVIASRRNPADSTCNCFLSKELKAPDRIVTGTQAFEVGYCVHNGNAR